MSPRLLLKKCASSDVTFVTLPYFMFILVIGTVAQRYMGLYGALDYFFYSWVLWLGPVPLPGGMLAMAVFFINLFARFIGYSQWQWNKAGIHLAHLSVLLLLLGGLVAGATRADTVLPLQIQDERNYSQSYDQSVFNIYKNGLLLRSYALRDLNTASFQYLPFNLEILHQCENCRIVHRTESLEQDYWQGAAASMMLEQSDLEISPEDNMPGVSFAIKADNGSVQQKFLTFLFFPQPPHYTDGEDEYIFTVEREKFELPFRVRLEDFRIIYHPGTRQARSYESDIRIIAPDDTSITGRISMNEPYHYQGYRLYQSAYSFDTQGNYTSIIAVSYNRSFLMPYFSGALMALGLLLHLIIKLKGRLNTRTVKFATVFIGLVLLSLPQSAKASDFIVGNEFAKLPVLHDGRIKPLESFSRAQFKFISGTEKPNRNKPHKLLAMTLFDPAAAIQEPLFDLSNLKNLHAYENFSIEMKSETQSYRAIAKLLEESQTDFITALQKQQRNTELSPIENDLLVIHGQSLYFLQLTRSFSYAMPLISGDDSLIPDYESLQRNSAFLQNALRAIREKKGDDFDNYTKDEQLTATLNYRLNIMENIGRDNVLFRVIPALDAHEKLVAPWQVLTTGQGRPGSREYLELWANLMIAYQSEHQPLWDQSIATLKNLYAQELDLRPLHYEYFYQRYDLIFWAILLLIAGSFFSLLSLFYPLWRKNLFYAAYGAAAFSALLLCTSMALRVISLSRPPVGTLYETILFVCLIMIAALVFIRKEKFSATMLTVGFFSCALLLALGRVIDQTGDNLRMLEAVLNTNFWLATHVVIITAGYGWCLFSAVLAHVKLYHYPQTSKNRTQHKKEILKESMIENLHTHLIISLLLISTGTILGGIWADMSWGRFWGWDPKENGALLIALWLIWILHSRASRHFDTLGFLIGTACLTIIVMLSWFGVNLLNVGLHSYGFIDGVAEILFGFISMQILILFWLYRRAYKMVKNT